MDGAAFQREALEGAPFEIQKMVPAAQVEAMMRWLVDEGHATPMALRQMLRVTRGG